MLTDFNVALGLVHKIGQKNKNKNSAPFYILIWLDAFYYLIFFFSALQRPIQRNLDPSFLQFDWRPFCVIFGNLWACQYSERWKSLC